MAHYFATFVVTVILMTHETIILVRGQCTVPGCDNGDQSISIVAEMRQLRDELFDKLDKQVQNMHELLNASAQEMKTHHHSINLSMQAVDRRLQNYELDIRNQTKKSWKLVNGICDAISPVRDCSDIKARGHTANGVYEVCVGHPPNRICTNAFCDMEATNGASLVFQRRKDGSVNFNRTWAEYKEGFGNPNGEFWLGNEMLHLLTSKRKYKLRVELEDWEGAKRYAEYTNFSINSSADYYRLTFGNYSGNAGDSLIYHNRKRFSTIDVDNDDYQTGNCALRNGGAWWYHTCAYSALNNKYYQRYDTVISGTGIVWYNWQYNWNYSLKATEMKLVLMA